MAGDYLPGELNSLWKQLGTSSPPPTPDQLRKEAERLRTGLVRRFWIGGGAAATVVVAWAIFFFIFPNRLQRIGSIVTVAGTSYMIVQLLVRKERRLPNLGEIDCRAFYRAELERQRDFHRGWWLWSRALLFMPGPVIWMIGFAQFVRDKAWFVWLELAAFLILGTLAIPANLRLAWKYQRRIDALDAAHKGND